MNHFDEAKKIDGDVNQLLNVVREAIKLLHIQTEEVKSLHDKQQRHEIEFAQLEQILTRLSKDISVLTDELQKVKEVIWGNGHIKDSLSYGLHDMNSKFDSIEDKVNTAVERLGNIEESIPDMKAVIKWKNESIRDQKLDKKDTKKALIGGAISFCILVLFSFAVWLVNILFFSPKVPNSMP